MVTELDKVISLVKKGNTISGALKVLGVNRTKFYKSITKEEKAELRFHKTAIARHGTPGHHVNYKCFENYLEN